MKQRIRLKHHFRYRFDNIMTGGIVPVIILLLLFATTLTFLITLVIMLIGVSRHGNISESFWDTFMHLIDQGTITGEDESVPWSFRLVMLVPTTIGILLVATLVGLITSRIQGTLQSLRRGRSLVLEDDHIVILGWSSKVFSIITELIKANINQDRACIVILAEKDKLDMELEIAEKVEKKGRTKIICRTGDPIDLDDLDIINHHHARSIIILSADDSKSDAENVKGIMAIVNHPYRKQELYHIVAELETDNNKEVANIIGGDELTLTVSSEIIARMSVQTCLQSGLSAVYYKLLDFASVEIYFQSIEGFQGYSFKEILMCYEDVIPIGIQRLSGLILLNPRMNTQIRKGDKIILIAEDDDELPKPDLAAKPIQNEYITSEQKQIEQTVSKILILGWNLQGPIIVEELCNYVIPGSEVCIVADEITSIQEKINELDQLRNLEVSYHKADITNRRMLSQIQVERFSNVLILSYSQKMSIQEADAHTLVTLMHLRDIKQQKNGSFTIVSEMLDIKNRTLAQIARPDDFIISDHVISLIISQLAENKELKLVFDELFDSHGAEFYLKPISLYLDHLEEVNFYTVMEAASHRQEVAVGYRRFIHANDYQKDYGVILNPPKSQTITFDPRDRVVVLAEEL